MSEWISTSDLIGKISISRSQLERLRKQQPPVFSAGQHFIAKGAGPKSGFLWNYGSVIQTMADLALQNEAVDAGESDG